MYDVCVNIFIFVLCLKCTCASFNCRERNNHLRQDGELCFEIPPWQHKPVEVENHLVNVREMFINNTYERRQTGNPKLVLVHSDINRYMDLVIAPFLDTYHKNIQNSFQQLTNKLASRIKEEINSAITKKQKIFAELTLLADKLNLPSNCDDERRDIRTISSQHVSEVHQCTEQARHSIAKMGKYAEEMISITKIHMESAFADSVKNLGKDSDSSSFKGNVTICLQELSRAAVALGYQLDLSLTNARRHNEQSCEKLFNCTLKSKKSTDEAVNTLREYLFQCVYA